MYEITKRLTFDAAHRLLGYLGPCGDLHGHTYNVEVTVQGRQLGELGMLLDFRDLTEIISQAGPGRWDHATLLKSEDPLAKSIDHVFLFDENPTAEVMARAVYDGVQSKLPATVELRKVRVYETPDSWADYGEE